LFLSLRNSKRFHRLAEAIKHNTSNSRSERDEIVHYVEETHSPLSEVDPKLRTVTQKRMPPNHGAAGPAN
jgi:hypothetical protein